MRSYFFLREAGYDISNTSGDMHAINHYFFVSFMTLFFYTQMVNLFRLHVYLYLVFFDQIYQVHNNIRKFLQFFTPPPSCRQPSAF